MQVRGLKLPYTEQLIKEAMSHLMQVRGLKPLERKRRPFPLVAPHAGAWIETQ